MHQTGALSERELKLPHQRDARIGHSCRTAQLPIDHQRDPRPLQRKQLTAAEQTESTTDVAPSPLAAKTASTTARTRSSSLRSFDETFAPWPGHAPITNYSVLRLCFPAPLGFRL
jgi:hypothetical protein